MLWPVAHVGSPASIKLLNKKLCTNFRLSLSCLFSEYRKRTVRSIATKRLVEKSHFCEHKAVRKSIRVHNCNSWVLICFQLSSCLHLLFSSAMIKHSEAKQPVEERVHLPTRHWEESGQEPGGPRGCRDHHEMPLSGCSVCFPTQPRAPCPGVTLPLSPHTQTGPSHRKPFIKKMPHKHAYRPIRWRQFLNRNSPSQISLALPNPQRVNLHRAHSIMKGSVYCVVNTPYKHSAHSFLSPSPFSLNSYSRYV